MTCARRRYGAWPFWGRVLGAARRIGTPAAGWTAVLSTSAGGHCGRQRRRVSWVVLGAARLVRTPAAGWTAVLSTSAGGHCDRRRHRVSWVLRGCETGWDAHCRVHCTQPIRAIFILILCCVRGIIRCIYGSMIKIPTAAQGTPWVSMPMTVRLVSFANAHQLWELLWVLLCTWLEHGIIVIQAAEQYHGKASQCFVLLTLFFADVKVSSQAAQVTSVKDVCVVGKQDSMVHARGKSADVQEC